jgi:hypothetical protein
MLDWLLRGFLEFRQFKKSRVYQHAGLRLFNGRYGLETLAKSHRNSLSLSPAATAPRVAQATNKEAPHDSTSMATRNPPGQQRFCA